MKTERGLSMLEASGVYVESAKKHEHRDPARAARSYAAAVRCLLSAAVNEFVTVLEGTRFLLRNGISNRIMEVIRSPDAAGAPNGVSAYDLSVLVHVSWLLENDDLAEKLLSLSSSNQLRSTPFLQKYNEGLRALAVGVQFDWLESSTRSLERYWKEYLLLISDITHGRDLDENLRAVASSLYRRNKDTRIRDDGNVIEGSAQEPVKWDFRAASLVSFVKRKYAIDLRALAADWSFEWE